MGKKTALNDDALMYKKHSDRVSKEQLKELSKKDKWQYFKDYYLKFVIIAIVAVIAIGYMLKTTIFNDVKGVLNIGSLSQSTFISSEILIEDLSADLQLNVDKEKVYINTFTKEDPYSQMAAFTQIGSGSIDVVLVDEEDFELYASQGALADLSEIFSAEEYNEFKDLVVMEQFKETDYDGNVIRTEDEKPYGIKINGSKETEAIITGDNGLYIAIMAGNENMDNAKACVKYLVNYIK